MLLAMTGAALGVFIVLGDGFTTELAAFAGYLILFFSLSGLHTHTQGSLNVKRLRAAALIAAIGMLVNLIPLMEWLGTVIEVIAYIIAISGYGKLNKCRGIQTSLSGFSRAQTAMTLLLIATIIHAIPSLGIGETIAAMLGLIVVVILSTAWIKSLGAIKSESQLSEEPKQTIENVPVRIEEFAEKPKLLRALNLSQLAFLLPLIISFIVLTISLATNSNITDNASLVGTRILNYIPFGVIIPLIIWNKNKSQFQSINMVGKMIMNFQLTLFLIDFLVLSILAPLLEGKINTEMLAGLFVGAVFTIRLFNICLIIINTVRCRKLLKPWYQPAIPFFKQKQSSNEDEYNSLELQDT